MVLKVPGLISDLCRVISFIRGIAERVKKFQLFEVRIAATVSPELESNATKISARLCLSRVCFHEHENSKCLQVRFAVYSFPAASSGNSIKIRALKTN